MKLFEEIKAGTTIFHEGRELEDAAVWKNRQLLGNHISALLFAFIALAHGFGFDFQLDNDTVQAAGTGIGALIAVGNSVLTVVTSTRVGLKP